MIGLDIFLLRAAPVGNASLAYGYEREAPLGLFAKLKISAHLIAARRALSLPSGRVYSQLRCFVVSRRAPYVA